MNGINNTFPLSLYGGYDSTMDGDCGLSSIGMGMGTPGSIFPMSFGGGCMPGMYGMSGMSEKELKSYSENLRGYARIFRKDLIADQLTDSTDLGILKEGELLRRQTPDDVIGSIVSNLQNFALNNEQDKYSQNYADLLNALREKHTALGYPIDENRLKAEAQMAYTKVTGSRMTDDLEAGGDGSFATGLKKGFFGLGLLFNKRSTQSNVAMVTERGVKVGDDASGESKSIIDNLYPDGSLSRKERNTEIAGEVIGVAATIAALPLVLLAGKGLLFGTGNSFLLGGKALFSRGRKV